MANRRLTKQERILTKKGVKIRKERLADSKAELKYLNEFDAFNKKWATYIQKKSEKDKKAKEKYLETARKKLQAEIKFDENGLKAELDHLENGVEIRKAEYVS